MSTTLITVLGSGVTALVLIIVFRIERARGRRFAEGLRSSFDSFVEAVRRLLKRVLPEINSGFFQEFAHYIMHMVLSKALGFLRRLESVTLTIVRFNRNQALKLRRRGQTTEVETLPTVASTASSEHLQAIHEHKKNIELTDAQKTKRRNAALMGKQ